MGSLRASANLDVAAIGDGFFEEKFVFWKISAPKRLLVPFLIILAAKIAGAIIVYSLLNIQASGTFWFDPERVFNWNQNTVFLQNINVAPTWSYTFVGWDSAWYLSIMTRGYEFSPQSYVFSPGLPFFGAMFNLFVQNPVVSMAICALLFGVLWVPFYQLVAEKYIGERAALASALLFAFSPYTFLFTTVAYTEGLFLFFALSAWYFFKKGRVTFAALLAGVSALARIFGLMLVLPLLFESLREKGKTRLRNVALSFSPVFAWLSWLGYLKLTTNDFTPFQNANEWSSLYTFRTLIFEGLPQKGINVFEASLQNYAAPLSWLTPFAVVIALAATPFFIYKVAKTDKALALYAVTCYVGVLLFGALASTPRYLSVVFPLWIPLFAKSSLSWKSKILLAAFSVASFIISLSLWGDFLNGNFVA